MSIRSQTPPNVSHRPVVNLDVNAFESLIWQKGYEVLLEEARPCPCRSQDSGSPLATCQNCRGFGWMFLNPIKTKAIISGINKRPKYGVEWSEESIGTISATFMNTNRLNEMDRVTFVQSMSKRSEVLKVREYEGQMFVFLTYLPVEILDVFYFESAVTPLTRLDITEYDLNENLYILELNFVTPDNFNGSVTVTYTCHPTYHVIDLPHDLRTSIVVNSLGQGEKIDLPIQAILRKAHLVLGVNDYNGQGVKMIDNSYL